jgi:cysteine synthase A
MVKINNLFPTANQKNIEVWMKLEKTNPGGSIKDRIALAMIEDAEQKGMIKKDTVIVEPTSGNTGVGLAFVCAVKGYKLILTMPESMSIERRKLLALYGAELVLTPREKGMKGAIEKARELVLENKNSFMPLQFDNQANVDIHRKTTATEILQDFPTGIDYLVTGIGTGGHITGVGEVLKEKFPHLKVIAVEPKDSPVLSGGTPGPHPLQGIGAGFIPSILNQKVYEQVITVAKEEAFYYAKNIALKDGIHIGISTGASLAAVAKVIDQAAAGSKIITFAYDTGERYLSIEGLF